MDNLMVFEEHEVEVLEIDGKVLFNPYHVGACLDIGESGVKTAVSKMNEKQVVKLTNSKVAFSNFRKLHNTGENFLTESGVYKLVFRSNKPNAEDFTDWVTDEVLPSIRKNGGYLAGQENDPPEVVIAKALVVAQNVIKENERRIAELTPKAEYFDTLVERNLLTNLRDTAKELGIKERRFIDWLERKGFIYRNTANKIKPFAPYITGDKKYFEIKEFARENGYTGNQTLVTPRGREAFRLLLKMEKEPVP